VVGKTARTLADLITRVSERLLLLSGLIIVVLAVVVFIGAALRYFVHRPEPYSSEISMMLLVGCSLLAFAGVQSLGRNVRADYLTRLYPPLIHKLLLGLVAPALGLFYSLIVTYYGWINSLYSLQVREVSHSVIRTPLFPGKVLVPIGFGLLCCVLIVQFCRGAGSMSLRPRKDRPSDSWAPGAGR
jgi:TRAP-type C4-dicarboxylate transport system permease small subunit